MGTACCSICVKALNGTGLPPLVKTSDDADGPPRKAPLDDPETGAPTESPAVPCATDALEGPKPSVVADPPETSPVPPLPAAERINRFRKSIGLFWNPGFTSSTT